MIKIRKYFGTVHAIAGCNDCEWENRYYKNSQANAAHHAKKHHHKVVVDLGLVVYYNGREKSP